MAIHLFTYHICQVGVTLLLVTGSLEFLNFSALRILGYLSILSVMPLCFFPI